MNVPASARLKPEPVRTGQIVAMEEEIYALLNLQDHQNVLSRLIWSVSTKDIMLEVLSTASSN